jgi:hypothetical protein
MVAAGTTGLLTAAAGGPPRAAARGHPQARDGTPEQIHLTWGDDPTRSLVVSWTSPGQAVRPRVRIGQRVITAQERTFTAVPGGAVSWTYHARVDGLRPGATYGYAVTADNDANAADPFSATFSTAPAGRAAFRFTSFGDLALPGRSWSGSSGQAAYAVSAVETFQPLFHLLNGGLGSLGESGGAERGSAEPGGAEPGNTGTGNTGTGATARAGRDFGQHVQASAANRPWLPVPGGHQHGPGAADDGLASYLTRYTLPSNGVDGFQGRWYAFRVGTALFVCLSGDDVAYSAAGAASAPVPAPLAGEPPAAGGVFRSGRGYSDGAQTRWLESTLAAARADASIDWVVVQLHQCACHCAPDGTGSDLGVRREWLPLFDAYEVDLVLSGHADGYERSFPVRGFESNAGRDAATGQVTDTRRPRPVTTVDGGVFDTSQGSVHLIVGCGAAGAGGAGREAAAAPPLAAVFTRPAPLVPDPRAPGGWARPAPDAVEEATWSARRDASTGYGIAVFDIDPGTEAGGQTSITVHCYHAAGPEASGAYPGGSGPADDYALFDTFTLVRPRSDGRRWHPKG